MTTRTRLSLTISASLPEDTADILAILDSYNLVPAEHEGISKNVLALSEPYLDEDAPLHIIGDLHQDLLNAAPAACWEIIEHLADSESGRIIRHVSSLHTENGHDLEDFIASVGFDDEPAFTRDQIIELIKKAPEWTSPDEYEDYAENYFELHLGSLHKMYLNRLDQSNSGRIRSA